jgi:hypothetical protein
MAALLIGYAETGLQRGKMSTYGSISSKPDINAMPRKHRNLNEWVQQHQGKHICGCGCGAVIVINKNHAENGIPRFKVGHSQGFKGGDGSLSIRQWIDREQGKHVCQCGCGERILIQKHHHSVGIPAFKLGHHPQETVPDTERFWSRVIKGPSPNDCWKWKGGKTKRYGYVKSKTKSVSHLAHRLSYLIHNGELPHDLDVLHKCDNPECTNPLHLFLGTQADNNRDAAAKGRFKATLNRETAVELVRRVLAGEMKSDVARSYGIKPPTLWAVMNGYTWSHATGIKKEAVQA